MHILGQDHQRTHADVVAAALEHRRGRLVARRFDSQHAHRQSFSTVCGSVPTDAGRGFSGGTTAVRRVTYAFTCAGLTRAPNRVVSMSTRWGSESVAGMLE